MGTLYSSHFISVGLILTLDQVAPRGCDTLIVRPGTRPLPRQPPCQSSLHTTLHIIPYGHIFTDFCKNVSHKVNHIYITLFVRPSLRRFFTPSNVPAQQTGSLKNFFGISKIAKWFLWRLAQLNKCQKRIFSQMSLLPLVLASFFLVGQVVVGKKSKLSQTHRVTYQNLCEKGTKPMIKTRAQSGLPVKRKIQKTTQNTTFLKNCIFGCFFWIFLLTGKPD